MYIRAHTDAYYSIKSPVAYYPIFKCTKKSAKIKNIQNQFINVKKNIFVSLKSYF